MNQQDNKKGKQGNPGTSGPPCSHQEGARVFINSISSKQKNMKRYSKGLPTSISGCRGRQWEKGGPCEKSVGALLLKIWVNGSRACVREWKENGDYI